MADKKRYAAVRRPNGDTFVMRVFGEGSLVFSNMGAIQFDGDEWQLCDPSEASVIIGVFDRRDQAESVAE